MIRLNYQMLNGFLKPKARISFQKLLGWYFRIGIHFSPLLIKWKVLKKTKYVTRFCLLFVCDKQQINSSRKKRQPRVNLFKTPEWKLWDMANKWNREHKTNKEDPQHNFWTRNPFKLGLELLEFVILEYFNFTL